HESTLAPLPDFGLAVGDRSCRQCAQWRRRTGDDDLRVGILPQGHSAVVAVCLGRRMLIGDRTLFSRGGREARIAVDRAHASSVGEVRASPAFAGTRNHWSDATIGRFHGRCRQRRNGGPQSVVTFHKCGYSIGLLSLYWMAVAAGDGCR